MDTENIRLLTITTKVKLLLDTKVYNLCFNWCFGNGVTAEDLVSLFTQGCNSNYSNLAEVFKYLYQGLLDGVYPKIINAGNRRYFACEYLDECLENVGTMYDVKSIVSSGKSTEQLAQELLDVL
jgi:hypothetical protein